MSNWPGNLIRKTPVTPAGPLQNGAAPGVWSLSEASYWTKQGLWPTAGNFLAVEDVFSTFLYTGTGAAQTITNGIDLAGKGGLVWLKCRSRTQSHGLFDTARGENPYLSTDLTNAQNNAGNGVVYNSNGFTNKIDSFFGGAGDGAGQTYASWTFREAPNFFDVVTYTGDGTTGRAISHNLGIAPGMIVIKAVSSTSNWFVYHRSTPDMGFLNLTNSFNASQRITSVTSSSFTVSSSDGGFGATNVNGVTYVAYLYAHDTASDGIIQCGAFTSNGSATVNLGWEPQWLLWKQSSGAGTWYIYDTMRGWSYSATKWLAPNSTSAEGDDGGAPSIYFVPTATGFEVKNFINNGDFIYMAIRRGPMKTPTLGTSVFMPWTRTGTGTTTIVSSTTFPPDLLITQQRSGEAATWFDRLRGRALSLISNSAGAEATTTTTTNDLISFNMNGITVGANQQQAVNTNGAAIVDWNLRRAPGFFDEVCYTGTGVARTVNHNLGVVPEMMIMKNRSSAGYSWFTWTKDLDLTQTFGLLALNTTSAVPAFSSSNLNSTIPTSTVFSVSGDSNVAGQNYVTYLFASCPGVSKVGSYTGNGSSQTINCAFTTGARFVLIKRTDSTGDWYVWDSARGIVAGNDPYLALNSTAAEVSSNDSVDTDNTGFIVNQVAASNVNVNGATYIFLAIA
jgi:hypothetical protein